MNSITFVPGHKQLVSPAWPGEAGTIDPWRHDKLGRVCLGGRHTYWPCAVVRRRCNKVFFFPERPGTFRRFHYKEKREFYKLERPRQPPCVRSMSYWRKTELNGLLATTACLGHAAEDAHSRPGEPSQLWPRSEGLSGRHTVSNWAACGHAGYGRDYMWVMGVIGYVSMLM
jgi:hypothetical protein